MNNAKFFAFRFNVIPVFYRNGRPPLYVAKKCFMHWLSTMWVWLPRRPRSLEKKLRDWRWSLASIRSYGIRSFYILHYMC